MERKFDVPFSSENPAVRAIDGRGGPQKNFGHGSPIRRRRSDQIRLPPADCACSVQTVVDNTSNRLGVVAPVKSFPFE